MGARLKGFNQGITDYKKLSRASINIDTEMQSVVNMRLFGLPYQFINSVDPRIPGISENVGTSFIDHIMMDAPTCFIIPGTPKFLPGISKEERTGLGRAFLESANGNSSGNDHNVFGTLLSGISTDPDDKIRYYDFQEDYGNYMKYVNIMCRSVAGFMGIEDKIVTGSSEVSFQQYDWKNYRWTSTQYKGKGVTNLLKLPGLLINQIKSGWNAIRGKYEFEYTTEDNAVTGAEAWTNNFVQFYIDPTSAASHNMGNNAGPSSIKGLMDTASSSIREFQYLVNSTTGKAEDLSGLVTSTEDIVQAILGEDSGSQHLGSILNQIISMGSQVLQGENIVLPDIYQASSQDVDYTIDIHLRAPYGNKYSVYVDVIVPFLHLLALTLPRQGSSNTFGSPFLIKCYYPGVFNCNLGLVESLAITCPTSDDSWTVDGLPTSMDCQLRIKDLYTDLSMSPSNDMALFRNNTNLIDYLATISGLSLIEPQYEKKASTMVTNYIMRISDIDDNVKSVITDSVERKLSSFLTL